MIIRPAQESDAAALIDLSRRVLDDSSFTHLLRSGETIDTVEEQADLIRWYAAAPNRRMLVAESDTGEIAGQATAFGGSYTADQGTAVVVIEVLPAERRKGIGIRLMAEIEAWARQQGLHRLELTVLEENQPALRLYEKSGYLIEGKKICSRRIHNRFHNEIIMAKVFPSASVPESA